jgi:aminoglycoside phosphotransferase (APT) family kinase protein
MTDPPLGSLIGTGKEAEVLEYGTAAVKLYNADRPKRSAFREAAILALLESFGLPVPAVHGVQQIDDRWGVIITRAPAPSFAEAVRRRPDLLPAYLSEMALLHLRVHAHPGVQFPRAKARLAADIGKAPMLGAPRRAALLAGLAAMPDGENLCHGDFHPLNILGPPGHAVIIDWPNASCGDPAADVCRSYVLIRPRAPEVASRYVDAYASAGGIAREQILAWLPFIAAARLAEGVPDEEAGLLQMANGAFGEAG